MTHQGPGGPWSAEAAHAGPGAQGAAYEGHAPSLFRMVLIGSLLTVLTVGVYRFWLKTAVRRYYWSATRLAGEPMEFTGRPIELLIGFLIAVVALALILGAVNLALVFVGLSFMQGSAAAPAASVLVTVPLIQIARYRARRYLLARTRWRGIRLSMGPGATGYAARWMLLWSLSVLSLGLLHPLTQFRLRRYLIERTWFGDLRFSQRGSALGLAPLWLPAWGVLALLVAWAASPFVPMAGATLAGAEAEASAPEFAPAMLLPVVLLVVVAPLLLAWYGAASHRRLAGWTRLGDATAFSSDLRARRLVWIWIRAGFGLLLASLLFSLAVAVVGAIVSGGVGAARIEAMTEAMRTGGAAAQGAMAAGSILLYIFAAAWFSAAVQILLTEPLLRAYVTSTHVAGIDALARAGQRPDEGPHGAEGLADAFDVGAAF